MSNETISESEMTECQFHNNCGGWCETRRELEHNLCEHCLEAHDEEMVQPVDLGKFIDWVFSLKQERDQLRALLAQPADTVLGFKIVEDPSMAPGTMRLVQPAEQHQGAPVFDDEILQAMADHGSPNDVRGTSTYDAWQALAAGRAVLALYPRPGAKPDGFEIARHSKRLVEQLRARIAELEQQPAPAAVVLPERQCADHFSEKLRDNADGWNACLDEVARLNPPQQ